MTYVESPAEWDGHGQAIFLAGGITNCPDWQSEARSLIEPSGITVINPRWTQGGFDIHDPEASVKQIAWEFDHLHRATVIMFWFPEAPKSHQPITFYELGRHAALGSRIVVGVEARWFRRMDVHEQLRHARPGLHVYDSLEATCQRAVRECRIMEAADLLEGDPDEFYRTVPSLAGMFWPGVQSDVNAELRRREAQGVR